MGVLRSRRPMKEVKTKGSPHGELAAAEAGAALSADAMAARINKGVRKKHARFVAETESAFGPSLKLRKYTLGNGLRVRLVRDPSAPVVAYHTWYRVGSRDERKGKTGIAHFFEHLMFKGTKNFAEGEFDQLLEFVGAESNAATWTDWTQYYENLPSAELELAIRLESDRMANLVLKSGPVESEREVVVNERRQTVEDSVAGRAHETLSETAYTKHGYGWPTIGYMDDIRSYTLADLREFYKTYYAPNNATVVVVGDFDEAETLGMIQRYYGSIAPSKLSKRRKLNEPKQTRERRATLSLPTPSEKIIIGYHGAAVGSRDYLALSILSEILGAGRSSRLYQRMVVTDELVTDVSASLAPFEEPGLFDIWATARPKIDGKKVLATIDAEIAKFLKDGPTEAELEKAKNRMELSFLQALESTAGKAEQIAFAEVVLGDASVWFPRLDMLREIGAEELQALAKQYLKKNGRTVVRVKPAKGAAS